MPADVYAVIFAAAMLLFRPLFAIRRAAITARFSPPVFASPVAVARLPPLSAAFPDLADISRSALAMLILIFQISRRRFCRRRSPRRRRFRRRLYLLAIAATPIRCRCRQSFRRRCATLLPLTPLGSMPFCFRRADARLPLPRYAAAISPDADIASDAADAVDLSPLMILFALSARAPLISAA